MDNLNEVFTALAKFHAEVSMPRKNGKNPFLKSSYARLPEILSCIAEVAPKFGLSHYSFLKKEDETTYCVTRLCHNSGAYLEDCIPLLMDKKMQVPMQGLGSCISYARRYSLQNLFGLSGAEDDDGESLRPRQPQQQGVNRSQPMQQPMPQRPAQQRPVPNNPQQREMVKPAWAK